MNQRRHFLLQANRIFIVAWLQEEHGQAERFVMAVGIDLELEFPVLGGFDVEVISIDRPFAQLHRLKVAPLTQIRLSLSVFFEASKSPGWVSRV